MADNDNPTSDGSLDSRLLVTSEVQEVVDRLRRDPNGLMALQRRAALGELIAGVTHETRNLLTAVLSFVQIGQRKIDDKEMVGDLLDKSETELLRCIDILTNVLDTARESNEDSEQRTPLEPNALVEAVANLVRHQAGLKRIALEVELSADVPRVEVTAELKQALLNLLVNAMHATPHNGVIRMTTSISDDGWVSIAVADSGPGIARELLDQIFTPFFTTKPAGQGTGLGLSMSRRIVRANGGTLTVDSTVGEGTTFEVRLPREGSR
jgi:signal transduction histidine kinase